MAKQTTVRIGGNKPLAVTTDEDDAPPAAKPVVKDVAEAAPEPESAPEPAPRVQVKKDKNDHVSITMLEEVNPAPRIGHCDVPTDLGIPILVKGESYRVPRTVAEMLKDSKKAAIAE